MSPHPRGARRSPRDPRVAIELDQRLYDLFLDPERVYTCAYFLTPDDTLEIAQEQKHRHLAAKLRLQSGLKVLDVGCGWGGLAFYLAHAHDLRVVGVNVASEQVTIALGPSR